MTEAGGVKCWGYQLPYSSGHTPGDVTELTSGVAAITVGRYHSCALTTVGGVKCWGWNDHGQLGDGSTSRSSTPVDVSGLTGGVAAIAEGDHHTCALTTAGGVKCWGDNGAGQLGDGSTNDSFTPVDVSGLEGGVAAIMAGSNYACALTSLGGVKCWGAGSAPIDVSGLTGGVVAITGGWSHRCALTSTGGAKCWGGGSSGQLGDGSVTFSSIPVDVSSLTSDVAAIAAGYMHTCALTSTGAVKCWGENDSGQLGDGSTTNRLIPVDVSGLAGGVAAIAAGNGHTCALTTPGGVKCWGHNLFGQLGDGSTNTSFTPVDVSGLGAGTAMLRGKASFSTASLALGSHNLTAEYSGDGAQDASTSPAVSHTVNQGATTTALVVAPNPSTPGQAVTLTATVGVTAPAAGTPSGSVTFKDGGVALGSAVPLDGTGQAQFGTAALALGGHALSAEYSGSTNFAGSVSPAVSQAVNKHATRTVLTATPNPARPGAAVTLAATVSSSGGTSTGSVTFQEGTKTLGSRSLSAGVARLDVAGLATGNHSVTASYSGSTTFASSNSATVATVDPRVRQELRVNDITAGPQTLADLARLSAARLVVVWQSLNTTTGAFRVFGQRLTSTGLKVGGQTRVDTTTIFGAPLPKVAPLPKGRFVVVWQSQGGDGSREGIFAQCFNANGARDGSETLVNTTTSNRQITPVVAALADGGYVVAWASYRQDGSGAGIYFQRFAANGSPVGSETQAHTFSGGEQNEPTVAGLNGGGFVVVWNSDGQYGRHVGIYAQRFSATGAKVGSEFRVNTTTAGRRDDPAVIGLADGGFAVTWVSDYQDGSGKGVYLQRYRVNGRRIGGETRVNTMTAGDQWQPALTALPGGGFVVVWASDRQDGSGHGVYAQRYKANGARDDVEFQVNTTTLKHQWQPAIAAVTETLWLAAWTSRDQDGSLEGIYAQRLDVVAP